MVLETLRGWQVKKLRKPTFLSGEPKEVPAGKYVVCSFCGKASTEVEKLIAGPGVNICNECVALCDDIVRESRTAAAPMAASGDVLTRLERLERLVSELRRPEGEV